MNRYIIPKRGTLQMCRSVCGRRLPPIAFIARLTAAGLAALPLLMRNEPGGEE